MEITTYLIVQWILITVLIAANMGKLWTDSQDTKARPRLWSWLASFGPPRSPARIVASVSCVMGSVANLMVSWPILMGNNGAVVITMLAGWAIAVGWYAHRRAVGSSSGFDTRPLRGAGAHGYRATTARATDEPAMSQRAQDLRRRAEERRAGGATATASSWRRVESL